ncbi:hypothetical protein [Coleofasciculus sp. H7-2]|uniref:hypothetical protein n=1 Tax=Coleofasciculus sp. H7-2 TaxID=3351545 RepID=UPI00366C04D2
MLKTTVRVVGVVALLDKVAEVKSVLRVLVEPTRQEDVCISYELVQTSQRAD